MLRKNLNAYVLALCMFAASSALATPRVVLTEGVDESAGGGAAYIISTPAACLLYTSPSPRDS